MNEARFETCYIDWTTPSGRRAGKETGHFMAWQTMAGATRQKLGNVALAPSQAKPAASGYVQMAGFSAFTHFSARHVTLYTGTGSSTLRLSAWTGRAWSRPARPSQSTSRHPVGQQRPCSAVTDPRRPFPWPDLG
ncbi:hypothetical protein CDEST_03146 [Colletotrichum destructivum]|uniref:Uncharacterized protein n=1 Tax=Colletotrichum destructivum TaxID=34406 RepID=A0AAX4I419_9PEZI|nr:hypothetical protein CDEST_03146 [Colletotrichum destructivum]